MGVGAHYDSREVFAGSRSCSGSSRFATRGSQSHYRPGRLRNNQGFSMNGISKTTPKFFAKRSAKARYPFNSHEHEIPNKQEVGRVQNRFRIKAKGEGCHYTTHCKIRVCSKQIPSSHRAERRRIYMVSSLSRNRKSNNNLDKTCHLALVFLLFCVLRDAWEEGLNPTLVCLLVSPPWILLSFFDIQPVLGSSSSS